LIGSGGVECSAKPAAGAVTTAILGDDLLVVDEGRDLQFIARRYEAPGAS